MSNLDGSVILVIGASGGLGTLLSTQLAAAGATVVRAGRSITGADAFVADLQDPAAAAGLVSAAIDAHGHLDGLVIAAGVVAFGPAGEVTDDTLAELFAVNAIAPIRLIRSALPALISSAEAGRSPFVITLSGIVSEAPTAGLAAYSASKAAIAAFVQATSREVRKAGIRMLDARPGHTETALAKHPIAGSAPDFPVGLEPSAVAARIVKAIIDGDKDLPSTAF